MHPDRFAIRAVDRDAYLELCNPTSDFYTATLVDGALTATERVYHLAAHGPGDGLAAYFKELAALWRGWNGERAWHSMEGELALSARTDRAGHVEVLVDLQNGAPFRWSARARLELEAGHLDRLARDAASFVSQLGRAV